MDVLGPYPSSHAEFNVLIGDIKPEDLPGRVSQALGVQYLDDMQSPTKPRQRRCLQNQNQHARCAGDAPCICAWSERRSTLYY